MLFEKMLPNVSESIPTGGTLFTAGQNANFKTAQGTSTGNTQVFTQSGLDSSWVDVQCGTNTMILLRSDRTLWAIGSNANGCTGQGTTTGTTSVLTQIGGDNDWASISLRSDFVFGIKTSGEMYSWGNNTDYHTGLNTNVGFTTTPTQVGTDTDWAFVSAGLYTGAAIKTSGELYTWGDNNLGGTGQNTTSGYTQVPTQVGTDTDWASACCATWALHAIKTGGTLWAAGYGPYIGFGSTVANYLVPTQIGSDTDWSKVSNASEMLILLKTDGTIYSYGNNQNGTTGQGTGAGTTDPITQIGSDNDWIDIAISGTGLSARQTLALKGTGELWDWGAGTQYQLGNNSTSNVLSPAQIGSDSTWSKIAAGGYFSAAIKGLITSNNLYSFGLNDDGATGLNLSSGTTNSPALVTSSGAAWVKVVSGGGSVASQASIGLRSDGTIWSWGLNNGDTAYVKGRIGQGASAATVLVPTQIGTDTDWIDIAQGNYSGFAIKSNGTLWAWGYNYWGQFGDGSAINTIYYTPTQIGSATNWAKVFCGYWISLAITNTGTMYVAGSNQQFSTGLNTNVGTTLTFTQLGSSDVWAHATASVYGGLAVRTNGTLWAWGTDTTGEIISGSNTPTQRGSDTDWKFVTSKFVTSNPVTFAVKTNGTLWTAGSNANYQSGTGVNTGSNASFTQVGSDTNWDKVYAVQSPTDNTGGAIGLKANGTIWSWGSNTDGMLGQGTSSGTTNNPTQIGTATNWQSIGANVGPVVILTSL